MRIQDALDKATASIRRVKEHHVRAVRGRPGETDIMTFIECWRGDQSLATIAHPPNRDAMLQCAWIAAKGFAPDVMAVTMETYQAEHTNADTTDLDAAMNDALNPVTGKPWQQGDMADLALNHDGIAKGWVVESLLTSVLNRAGDSASRMQPYRIHGRDVEWLGLRDSDEYEYVGLVPDRLAHAMNSETVDTALLRKFGVHAALLSMSEERLRAHADLGAVRAIERTVEGVPFVQVLLASRPGTERDQVLRDHLPRSSLFRPE